MSCGKYSCQNCKWFKYSPSDNYYYEPDIYECSIDKKYEKKINEEVSYTKDELDAIFVRVYYDGEEWDNAKEPLCPYYKKRIIRKK